MTWIPVPNGTYKTHPTNPSYTLIVRGGDLAAEWSGAERTQSVYIGNYALCRQVPDAASSPAEVVEAWKVVADALPQGLNFEIYSAVLTVNDWICGRNEKRG